VVSSFRGFILSRRCYGPTPGTGHISRDSGDFRPRSATNRKPQTGKPPAGIHIRSIPCVLFWADDGVRKARKFISPPPILLAISDGISIACSQAADLRPEARPVVNDEALTRSRHLKVLMKGAEVQRGRDESTRNRFISA
jgi:hypothetical protein